MITYGLLLLKQGCVLSSCFSNLVIADLDSILNDNGGVEFGASRILSGINYSDDILIVAENEQNLIYLPANEGSNSMTKSHKSSSLVKVRRQAMVLR